MAPALDTMQLPQNKIGPTDILQHRDCPARFAFGMRRHMPEGEKPEATSPENAYGSAIHDVLSAIGEGKTDEEAIRVAFARWNAWLDPEDLDQMREDIETYHRRDYGDFTLLANEREIEVPLLEYDGAQIYFRARIDRLYAHPTNPGLGIHIDYKSSKHRKTEKEVHRDLQIWPYNWAIHEYWPELETLVQRYDQLRFGVVTTGKNADQRRQIKDWLAEQAIAIIEDDELKPKFNKFCSWCPLLESCGVVRDLSSWATTRLVALAPPRKIGRKTIADLDPDLFEVYLEQLEGVGAAQQALSRFEKAVREALREMPSDRRTARGFALSEPSLDVWDPEALRAAHEVLGDDFYDLVKLTKTAIQAHPDEGKANAVLAMAERVVGPSKLKRL